MTNLPTKFGEPRSNHSQDIEQKCFFIGVAAILTFDLVTPKTIGILYTSRPTSLPSLVNLGQTVLKILSGNVFYIGGRRDLDL